MSVTLKTNLGDLKVELACDIVPKTCENFLALCGTGAYDGTSFHRLIPGFMIQGGDPTGTGRGGSSIWGGKFADEFSPLLKHDARGVLAMANKGPNSNGSQFYIMFDKAPHLNNRYTVFGHVIDGWDTLAAMERVPVDDKHHPQTPIILQSCIIHANPLAE